MATITRQDVKKKARPNVKRFRIKTTLVASCELEIDNIWPDGDAPTNPKAEDVVRAIEEYGDDLYETICEWNLLDEEDGNKVEVIVDVDDIPIRSPK